MQARSIETGERRAAMLARAAILAATVLTGGCAQIIGIEDLPPLPVDAGPSGFAVRGSATGVLGPVALELRIDEDSELLAVTQEGAFSFDTRLETGASYAVVLVDPVTPCTLRNQTGVIAGADTPIELNCTGASLTSVVLSGVVPPTVTLVPGTADYVVDVSLLQQSVTLTASVATAGDTLTIAGTPVASGAPSAELTLSLGDNPVDIVVENDLGWRRTYRLTLRRAAQLTQYAYGKASNTGASDWFGISVALSGDTLAVGAYGEASAAQGVGGNQGDNSASQSGAVYVFRRSGSAWAQEAYLKASNTGAGDEFGISVALSGDTLAVGARSEDSAAQGVGGNQGDNTATDSGAIYVFRRSGSAWAQEAYLKASNTGAGDSFGIRVALSGDTLAVGAYFEASAAQGVGGNQGDDSATESGAVYVFH
jgi:trimeric autotransporter adhesin